jgi:hypothetical protein
MKTPVLLILFNRLDTTRQVFQSIREYSPVKLYIAADGPRREKEAEKVACARVREWVLSHINWNCDVKTLFRSDNLGCGKGPASAISWFFTHEEEGIILEDDCVPNRDFFQFSELLLNHYRNNNRISIISGSNFDINKRFSRPESYFYSVFPYTWGWATWKRNWDEYDYHISQWKNIKQMDLLHFIFKEKKYWMVWKHMFDNLNQQEAKDIWDYQFFFHCFIRQQLSIVPSENLISNIGIGEMATHTTSTGKLSNLKLEQMTFPLVHTTELIRNIDYDIFLQEINFGIIEQVSLYRKMKRYIKDQLRNRLNC